MSIVKRHMMLLCLGVLVLNVPFDAILYGELDRPL